jgi:Family of unknown function (DUF5313)
VTRLPGDPGAGGKVLFAIGGRLPERNREWVRHELTDAGWRSRLTLRHLVIMLPLGAVLALLPGAVWIRIAVPALFEICSVGIVSMYADDIRVSRLRRHGLEPPDDPDLGRPSHLAVRVAGVLGWAGVFGVGAGGGKVGGGVRGTFRSA